MACPTGISNPPAMPCTKRQPTTAAKLPAIPQAATASANTSMEAASKRRAPQRLASQVLMGITKVKPRM